MVGSDQAGRKVVSLMLFVWIGYDKIEMSRRQRGGPST